MSMHLLKGSKLTGTIERVLPVRSPSLQCVVEAPTGRRRTLPIVNLQSIAEPVEANGLSVDAAFLPIVEDEFH